MAVNSRSEAAQIQKPLLIVKSVSWEVARNFGKRLPGFVFRGQADKNWALQTKIERSAAQYDCPSELIPSRERQIIREFQRRAHHYLQLPPSMESLLEWLALIQHFGGPTRLLDFSHSFYVAAYFAVEFSVTDAAIWCVNSFRLDDLATRRAPDETTDDVRQRLVPLANSYITSETNESRVLVIDPFRLHERASLQQGCYLFPCSLSESFMSNLFIGMGHKWPEDGDVQSPEGFHLMKDDDVLKYNVIKMELPELFHREALSDLREMNITAATLFPGLDGYARSLDFHMRAGQMLRDFRLNNLVRRDSDKGRLG